MKKELLPSIKLTLAFAFFFCVCYIALINAFSLIAPNGGKGEVVTANGKQYYKNIGQKFTDDKYFNSRPSAVDYNAAGAAGSNKGPSNPDYLAQVAARIDTFLVHNPGVKKEDIPSELVTASGSGLDPDISVKAANIQVKRIAAQRGIAEGNVQQLILGNTQKPLLGLFGTEKVNVLQLNIALENLK